MERSLERRLERRIQMVHIVYHSPGEMVDDAAVVWVVILDVVMVVLVMVAEGVVKLKVVNVVKVELVVEEAMEVKAI